jgi:DNA-binding transcriptional LysR family regulator
MSAGGQIIMRGRYGIIPNEMLRTLVVVHDLGNFSNAAEELGVTPAAISAQIKRLERLLGSEVFVTSARGLKLSARGIVVEQYARRILALNDQIMAQAGEGSGEHTIRLGLQSVFAPSLMPRVIIDCEAVYPQGEIKIDCDSSPGLLNALASGFFDVIFALAPSESRLYVVAEWTEKMVWVCAPNFNPRIGAAIPLISRASGFVDGLAVQALKNKDVPYRAAYNTADLSTRIAIAATGKGVMVLPKRVVPSELIIASHGFLPELPDVRAGVFLSEGLDICRIRSVVEAFATAVAPPGVLKRERVARLHTVPALPRHATIK